MPGRSSCGRHPASLEEWDWRRDPVGPEALQRSVRRLNVAIDYDDPRAPDQMAVVLRTDLSRLTADWTHKDAAFWAWRGDHDGWRSDFTGAPTEAHDFFLVRPVGHHPSTGKPYLPTIVQRIDGELFSSTDQLKPLYFGEDLPDDHPMKTRLEWRSLPSNWLYATHESHR